MRSTTREQNPIFFILGALAVGAVLLFSVLGLFRGTGNMPSLVKLKSPSAAQWKSAPNILDLEPIDGQTWQVVPKSIGKCLIEFKTSTGIETFSVDVKSLTVVKIEATEKRGALFKALIPAGSKPANEAE